MKILIAVLMFSAIVLFHELGHFLLAKKNKVTVLEFSLGMGPRLFSFVRGGTQYSLKLLPLGGSCQMLGEDEDECMPGSFPAASVWARISIVAAGPVFNFLLAFVLALIIIGCIGYVPARVTGFLEQSPAYREGLREGDIITEYQGYTIDIGNDLYIYQSMNRQMTETVALTYERDGKKHTIQYRPKVQRRYLLGFTRNDVSQMKVENLTPDFPLAQAGIKAGDVITGINGVPLPDGAAYQAYLEEHPLDGSPVLLEYQRRGKTFETEIVPKSSESMVMDFQYNLASEKTSPGNVLKYSLIEVKYWVRTTLMSLKQLLTGEFGVKDLSGPVGVVTVIGDTYEQSREMGTMMLWMNLLNIAILLSANLGVMNLLPLPALDGGRLLFFLYEAVFHRPVNRKLEGSIHFAGFLLLMLLMAVVMYQDLLRIL